MGNTGHNVGEWRKRMGKKGTDQKRASGKRAAPYHLVRFAGAFDAGEKKAGDKRHIIMFPAII